MAKRLIAEKAWSILKEEYLENLKDPLVIGVGSGSTVKEFIKVIDTNACRKCLFVAASEESKQKLLEKGLQVIEFESELEVYFDGADAIYPQHSLMIKGGGGALLREKILMTASKSVYVLAEEKKWNQSFMLPFEVLLFACKWVLSQLPTNSQIRQEFLTDNGNLIIDIPVNDTSGLNKLSTEILGIPGVLESGLFSVLPQYTFISESSVKIAMQ